MDTQTRAANKCQSHGELNAQNNGSQEIPGSPTNVTSNTGRSEHGFDSEDGWQSPSTSKELASMKARSELDKGLTYLGYFNAQYGKPSKALIISTPTDRVKCSFVEMRECLRTKMIDFRRLQDEETPDSPTKDDARLLLANLEGLKRIFVDLVEHIPDKEAYMFKFDLKQFEKSVKQLTSSKLKPTLRERPMHFSYFPRKRRSSGPLLLPKRKQHKYRRSTRPKSIQKPYLIRKVSRRRSSVFNYRESSDTELSESSACSERTDGDSEESFTRGKGSVSSFSGDSSSEYDDESASEDGRKRRTKREYSSKLGRICIVCTDDDILASHPFFIGWLCKKHVQLGQERIFQYNVDGYMASCCICFKGSKLVTCDHRICRRSYCASCLTRFVSASAYNIAVKSKHWVCIFCRKTGEGRLLKRLHWQDEMERFFESADPEFPPFSIPTPVTLHDRKPIRVLSLFDGIATGMLALQQLGIQIGKFVASEINEDAIKLVKNKHPQVIHIGDITKLSDDQIYKMGPFDLLIGGSPCNDLSSVNPRRKGLLDPEGTGCLFFDYYRILKTVEPPRGDDTQLARPFFWLFENVASMQKIERQRISRFLQCGPRMADARSVSAAARPRLFWGNIPGLLEGKLEPDVNDRLSVQDCLETGRKACFEKLNTITTKYSSLYQGGGQHAPVVHDGKEDVLWTTEVERVFGVPEHYTDVNNLGPRERIALLGRSWSVPVIKRLLSPLRNYFKCEF